ncbi:MAG: ribonuclease HII [Verrucomicrobiota bacterium]
MSSSGLSPKRWLHDKRLMSDCSALVGVDEVGRGCLAGPVVASAVVLRLDFFRSHKRREVCLEIRDSKQIAPDRREALVELIREWRELGLLGFAIAEGSIAEIERLNILGANTLAMQRALSVIVPEDVDWEAPDAPRILVDGKPVKRLGYPHEAIVKGDDVSLAIAMASVLAKVYRDRLMVHADKVFPAYGFCDNKGYGTIRHREALLERGPCQLHRPSFLQKILDEPASKLQTELPF